MSLERFLTYAMEFEQAYNTGEWAALEPYFTEDAVYEILPEGPLYGVYEGRDQVIGFLEWITDSFDKKFEKRRIVPIDKPEMRDGDVVLHGAAVYSFPDGERSYLILEETAVFEGDRISRLTDVLTPGTVHEMLLTVEKHPELFPAKFEYPVAA